MRRYSPPYHSPPRRGYGGRRRSSPRREFGGHGGRKEQNHGSLLVRNIPLKCRPEDLRGPFERFGPVRDVYLPKDYYTGEPRGFAFVQFVDPYDASEAQYHMNCKIFGGREITVVFAAETRKRPEEMRGRDRVRGPSGHDARRSSHYGLSRSHTVSRSRSPHYPSSSRMRRQSRSYSPAARRGSNYSASPPERRRSGGRTRSPGDHPRREDADRSHKLYSPNHSEDDQNQVDNGYNEKASYDDGEGSRSRWRSLKRTSGSPPGSRSRSADSSPMHKR